MAGSASDQGPVQKVVGIEVKRDWATLLAVSRPGVAKVKVKTEVEVKTEVDVKAEMASDDEIEDEKPGLGEEVDVK